MLANYKKSSDISRLEILTRTDHNGWEKQFASNFRAVSIVLIRLLWTPGSGSGSSLSWKAASQAGIMPSNFPPNAVHQAQHANFHVLVSIVLVPVHAHGRLARLAL